MGCGSLGLVGAGEDLDPVPASAGVRCEQRARRVVYVADSNGVKTVCTSQTAGVHVSTRDTQGDRDERKNNREDGGQG